MRTGQYPFRNTFLHNQRRLPGSYLTHPARQHLFKFTPGEVASFCSSFLFFFSSPNTKLSTRSNVRSRRPFRFVQHHKHISPHNRLINSPKMPRWTPELNEILLALVYDCTMPLISKEMQVKIIDELNARGHPATWDQVRYVSILAFFGAQLFPRPPAFQSFPSKVREVFEPSWFFCSCHSKLFQLSLLLVLSVPQPTTNTTQHGRFISSTKTITVTMPVRWDEIRDDLFEVVYKLCGPLSKDDQIVVEREMQSRGYDISWNGIRYVLTRILSSTTSSVSPSNQAVPLIRFPVETRPVSELICCGCLFIAFSHPSNSASSSSLLTSTSPSDDVCSFTHNANPLPSHHNINDCKDAS